MARWDFPPDRAKSKVARFKMDSHFHHLVRRCWFLLRWKIRCNVEWTARISLSIVLYVVCCTLYVVRSRWKRRKKVGFPVGLYSTTSSIYQRKIFHLTNSIPIFFGIFRIFKEEKKKSKSKSRRVSKRQKEQKKRGTLKTQWKQLMAQSRDEKVGFLLEICNTKASVISRASKDCASYAEKL